ncbi:MAG: MerR family DNA-binding transcriptional regulator [Novosphingobium sp.]
MAAAIPSHDGSGLPDEPERTWSISDLTAEFGTTARALRFYEDEGLLAPARHGLTRVYGRRDRARLAWILRGKNVGFSLTEIKELIDLYDIGDGRVAQRLATIERCREKVAKLQRHRADIDASIAELTGFITHLEAMEMPPARRG